MKKILLGIAAAMLVALMVVVLPQSESHSNSEYEVGSYCPSGKRVSSTDATCLTATWDNSGAGTTYSVTNECSEYGNVHTRINTRGEAITDIIWNLNNTSAATVSITFGSVSSVSCCLDRSDICYRNQVEANDRDRITVISVVNGAYNAGWQDVSTHQLRYDFCQANTNNIYCTNDPSGDANRDPASAECGTDSTPDCNCGDHFCTVDDCNSAWDGSPAVDTCADASWNNENSYTMTISATDGSSQTCNITVDCMTGGVADDGVHAEWADGLTWSASVGNFDDLRNCEGTLEDGSCANDNEVTRNAAGTVVVNGN